MGRTLVLWRHGRTDWNDENRFQGSTDIPLNEVGIGQAENAARLVASFRPAAIVSSDLSRAFNTALPLGRITGLPIATDPDLRETNGGDWEGRVGADIRVNDGATFAAWLDSENVIAGTTGERRSDVAERAHRAIVKAFEPLNPDATLVAVTHGGAARCLIAHMLGLGTGSWGAIGGLSNCAWSVLEEVHRNDKLVRWRLVEHNGRTLPQPISDEVS
ncbi:MAG TPA: histidine phosphatase family protein [Candidatus Nanopelagicaceae bacterium]|nr:histidine phosphatase family protein [Candidatus Nanopelagicaceae bacterium]